MFILFLFVLIFIALAASFYFAYTAMKPECHSPEKQIQWSLIEKGFDPKLAEIPFEDWQLKSGRGGSLQARFYPKSDNRNIVLLLHGYNAPWISMLKYFELLDSMGFAILIPDHQAQGRSEGKWISYGAIESEDAVLWMKELRKKYPTAEIAVMGESMGAATALLTAEKCCKRDIAISFCVADCPYNDCKDELKFVGQKRYGILAAMLMPLVGFWFKALSGCKISEASPLNYIDELRVKTLLVHGSGDMTVPVAMSRKLAKLNPNISYWEAEGVGHASVIAECREEYRERMKAFIEKEVSMEVKI